MSKVDELVEEFWENYGIYAWMMLNEIYHPRIKNKLKGNFKQEMKADLQEIIDEAQKVIGAIWTVPESDHLFACPNCGVGFYKVHKSGEIGKEASDGEGD